MPAAEITAALIAAAATSASTAVAAGVASNDPGNGGLTAVVENQSFMGWNLKWVAPAIHGMWANQISLNLDPLPQPQVVFDAWKNSGNAPKSVSSIVAVEQLSAADELLFKLWIEKSGVQEASGTLVDQCVIEGKGKGSEALWIYQSSNSYVWLICWMSNRPTESFKAGAVFGDFRIFEMFGCPKGMDQTTWLELIGGKVLVDPLALTGGGKNYLNLFTERNISSSSRGTVSCEIEHIPRSNRTNKFKCTFFPAKQATKFVISGDDVVSR